MARSDVSALRPMGPEQVDPHAKLGAFRCEGQPVALKARRWFSMEHHVGGGSSRVRVHRVWACERRRRRTPRRSPSLRDPGRHPAVKSISPAAMKVIFGAVRPRRRLEFAHRISKVTRLGLLPRRPRESTARSTEDALPVNRGRWGSGIRFFDTAPYGYGLGEGGRASPFAPNRDRSSRWRPRSGACYALTHPDQPKFFRTARGVNPVRLHYEVSYGVGGGVGNAQRRSPSIPHLKARPPLVFRRRTGVSTRLTEKARVMIVVCVAGAGPGVECWARGEEADFTTASCSLAATLLPTGRPEAVCTVCLQTSGKHRRGRLQQWHPGRSETRQPLQLSGRAHRVDRPGPAHPRGLRAPWRSAARRGGPVPARTSGGADRRRRLQVARADPRFRAHVRD